MSFNIVDFTLFDQLQCTAESHYNRTFAQYQKYSLSNIVFTGNACEFLVKLIHTKDENNREDFSEIVIDKQVLVSIKLLYNSNLLSLLVKSIDLVLNPYYLVELVNNEIILTAKNKGKIPNPETPELKFDLLKNIEFIVAEKQKGEDTVIFSPNNSKKIIHIPKTGRGKNFDLPNINDRLIFIDTLEKRDRTFTRKIVNIERDAKCTCDILHLDLPIDRIDESHKRLSGIGLPRAGSRDLTYTANFDNVKIFKRKNNYAEILESRGKVNNRCTLPFLDSNAFNMQNLYQQLLKDLLKNSENTHLSSGMQYYGMYFKWYKYKEIFQPIWDAYGDYLREDIFLLTSNKNRPEYLVHIDYDLEQKMPVIGSLTWPVLNCTKNTVTVWYDAYLDGKRIYEYGEMDRTITNPNIQLLEIDRFYFDTELFNPVILKHDDWHTLYNNAESENNRMLLQWRFKPDIPWEKIKEITKSLWYNS